MEYSLELIVLSVSILLLFYVKFIYRTKPKSTEREAPEPNGAWPIIGHLHLLAGSGGGEHLLYRTLGAMADKYGPVFNIRIGTKRAFVISSWEVAKECFTVHDKVFATRPKTTAIKHMCYNFSMFSLAPYSPYWRQMKKIAVNELLSNHRVEMLKDVRSSEISWGINQLYERWTKNSNRPVPVKLNKWFEETMLNIIVMMVAGKRYYGVGSDSEEAAKCQKAIIDFFLLIGIIVPSDVVPFLGWLDLKGYEKKMKETARNLDSVLEGWLNEHRQKRKRVILNESKADSKDFIDVMLSLEDEGQLSNMEHGSDTSIKSTCIAMIAGANNTTSVTLTWAISLLLNNPDALEKLKHEIDDQVGLERLVDESDLKHLLYLEAIIKETMRLYPSSPLLGPREAMEDCTVAGYNVKSGTRLIVNVWKLQRDPRVWTDPSKFQPERFMSLSHKDVVDLRGQQFILVPFGYGRRACPGSTFAIKVIHLTLARLVHSFDLHHPGGLPVDMTEGSGLTVPKKKPLEVLLTPRLPSRLYGCY